MRTMGVLLAFLAASVPAVSSAGSASFPHYLVNPITTQGDGSVIGVFSAIHVSNILTVPQTVKIVLYNVDGTPLANYPVSVWNASLSHYDTTTDANGALQVTLGGLAQLGVQLTPSAAPVGGWGTVEGTSGYNKSLIADVEEFGRLPATGYPGTAYNVSFAVNAGAPF